MLQRTAPLILGGPKVKKTFGKKCGAEALKQLKDIFGSAKLFTLPGKSHALGGGSAAVVRRSREGWFYIN